MPDYSERAEAVRQAKIAERGRRMQAADDPRDEDDDVREVHIDASATEFANGNGLFWYVHSPGVTTPYASGYLPQVIAESIERRRVRAVPQANDETGTFTALDAARLAVGFGDGEDYCGSCGAHWRDIQNGCRLHPLWNVLASTEAERAVQVGGGDEARPECRECRAGLAQARAADVGWFCTRHGPQRLSDYAQAGGGLRAALVEIGLFSKNDHIHEIIARVLGNDWIERALVATPQGGKE